MGGRKLGGNMQCPQSTLVFQDWRRKENHHLHLYYYYYYNNSCTLEGAHLGDARKVNLENYNSQGQNCLQGWPLHAVVLSHQSELQTCIQTAIQNFVHEQLVGRLGRRVLLSQEKTSM